MSTKDGTPFSLLAVGVMFQDVLLTVPHYPNEDSKVTSKSLTSRVGGNIPNTFAVLSQVLPASASLTFATAVGGDAAIWRPMIDEVEALGGTHGNIKVLFEVRDGKGDSMPTAYIIESEATRTRSIISHNIIRELGTEAILSLLWSHSLRPKHFTPHAPTDYETLLSRVYNTGGTYTPSWLHFEGRNTSTIRGLISHYKSRRDGSTSPTVSIEFEKWGREGLWELLGHCDIAFFAEGWAKEALAAHAGGDKQLPINVGTPQVIDKEPWIPSSCHLQVFFNLVTPLLRPSTIAFLTVGSIGAYIFHQLPSTEPATGISVPWKHLQWVERKWTMSYVPALVLADEVVVETTGAGDTLIAGIIYALGIRGMEPVRACEVAVRVAGRKCCKRGFEDLQGAFEEVEAEDRDNQRMGALRKGEGRNDVEIGRKEGLL